MDYENGAERYSFTYIKIFPYINFRHLGLVKITKIEFEIFYDNFRLFFSNDVKYTLKKVLELSQS